MPVKKLIWIIGKPGSGKTTIGHTLSELKEGVVHFSYGQLLKEVQPNPGVDGYSMQDREKVNEIIIQASLNYVVVVIDGNPYSQIGFGFIDQIRHGFDEVKVVHLCISDSQALSRLEERGREVLAHDGAVQADRIKNFNEKTFTID
jgi:adenylate kinase family enzyme